MNKKQKIDQFDPNGIGLQNNHFIGLPFDENEADIILFPVPWDVTVSATNGTASAPQNILEASPQLDLFDPFVKDAWKAGIYFQPIPQHWVDINNALRADAHYYIQQLEEGATPDLPELQHILKEINHHCEWLEKYVYSETKSLLEKGKLVGLVGGEHSVPLGFLKALANRYESFGVLQIDAHLDLRPAYEGFSHSHASIFHNALAISNLTQLTSVGIRDFCEQEFELTKKEDKRIQVFYEHAIRERLFLSESFDSICKEIVATLPQQVYISFDIDGLDPKLCPHTGTPVPGGLQFEEALYLIKKVVDSGRTIIGFDLCEVAGLGNPWDGNVGARILYRVSNLMWLSNQK